MEQLRIYTPENSRKIPQRRKQTIRIARSGVITFNTGVIDLVGLTTDHKVLLAQDPGRPTDWYFKVIEADQMNGFDVRHTPGGQICFNCRFLANKLLDLFVPAEKTSAAVPVAKEPTEEGWWPLITSAIKER